MKLTLFLLLFTLMTAWADVKAQRINLRAKQMSLEKVLVELSKQSAYTFVYKDDVVNRGSPITIALVNSSLEESLELLLKPLALTYQIKGRSISIKSRVFQSDTIDRKTNRQQSIRGRVVDSHGNPLAGATVRVKGNTAHVISNEDGLFILENVERNASIQISYVGYRSKMIKAGSDLPDIILEMLSSEVEEVEVSYATGYQNLSRERSTGAFAKPNLDIMKNRSSGTNVLQRLDGLVPGLTINKSPNRNPISIRGLTSINSTREPLVVVDGVELQGVSIQSLNMQDIEDITVLKDASSSSIWGAKAANGVIVITTKKGKSGQDLRIEYDGFQTIERKPDLNYIPTMNSKQFITTVRELFPLYVNDNPWSSVEVGNAVTPHLNIQYGVPRGILSQQRADQMLDSLAGIDNKRQIADLFYRNAVTNNHTISVSSGGNTHSFYGSLGYIGLQSAVPGEKDNRFKLNLRQDLNINKHLQLFLVTDLGTTKTSARSRSRSLNAAGDGNTNLTVPVPYQLLKDQNNNPLTVNYMGSHSDSYRIAYQARSRVNLDYVPLEEINRGRNYGSELSARLVGGGKINIYKGLRFEGTYGYNVSSLNNRSILDQESYTVREELMRFTQADNVNTLPVYFLPNTGGRLTENNSLIKNWTVRNQLLYDLEWKNAHEITALFGQEATSTTPLAREVVFRGWDDKLQRAQPIDYQTLVRGIPGTVPGGTRQLDEHFQSGGEGIISRTTSYYSNLNYSYLRKYTVNASWRIDESNLFGIDKSTQNRPVYSIGGKWALGSEEFMQNYGWLAGLDLRFTYGITGNAPTPRSASSHDILSPVSDLDQATVNGTGLIIFSPANRRLSWEATTVYNGGIDFEILHGRLSGFIDGYLKKTRGLIGNLSTSPLTGFTSITGNFGNMENKGIDLLLNSVNISGEKFVWRSSFTLGYNRNKITKLSNAIPNTTGEAMMNVESFVAGYPAFALFAYNYGGLNAQGDPQIILADGTRTSDRNISTPKDVLYMGTVQPIWTGGISNTFHYKNFQLDINMVYNAGHKKLRDGNRFWTGVPYINEIHPEFANRWKEPGDENKTQIPRYVGNINYERSTSYYENANNRVFDASFLKIRDITLSYALAKKYVQRLGAKGVSFRFQLSDIMLWRANRLGIDPEFHTERGGRALRYGQGQVTFGAHITL